jgi:hypothetical protein
METVRVDAVCALNSISGQECPLPEREDICTE